MKQCPACNRTYTDDAQLFCLEDGAQLRAVGGGGAAQSSFDPNATLAYTPARETNPPPQNFYPQAPTGPPAAAPPSWSPPSYTPSATTARKSNKPWIIGAIAAVVVLGIGIVVLLAVIGRDSASNTNKNSNRAIVSNANAPRGNANNANKATIPSTSNLLKDDFSAENWPTGEGAYGSFYEDGEYHMKGKPKLYVFMFPLNRANYETKDATVKVTTRSVDGKSPEYGYGLIVHGKADQKGTLDGYGFLIYTGATPKYEIVRFNGGEPTTIVPWAASGVIRGGTNSNQIEVRTDGSQLSMYVNGQFLKSITDTANFNDGYVGLYTSETNEVAFDDMEVDRETSDAKR
ncbi:MAG TPA: hypothetical protein VJT09_09470 [Pyrinomonadaceae bacterium]|nr:hypothetical protein [Pyrinomonadaceae bacterium]